MISKLEGFLHSKATRFRYALEQSEDGWSPLNKCVITTVLFAIYLREEFPEMVSEVIWIQAMTDKRFKINHGHSWLEVDGYVIDITMDQFNSDPTGSFNKDVNANAPYLQAYACRKENSIQRRVFKSFEPNIIDKEFSILDKYDVMHRIDEIERIKKYMK
jgi:hypothetical protein